MHTKQSLVLFKISDKHVGASLPLSHSWGKMASPLLDNPRILLAMILASKTKKH